MAALSPEEEQLAVLFHAALLGRTDVLSKVISDVKSKPSTPSEVAAFISTVRADDGSTALHIASACGHSDVLRALLQHGVDPSIVAKSGDYEGKKAYEVSTESTRKVFHVSLFEQVALGNVLNLSRLLSGGVPVDIKDGSKTNDTPIHWACSFGNIEVVEQLIANGCDVNVQNDAGQTALHYACKANNEALAKLLLSEGADVDIVDSEGHKADYLASPEICEIINSRSSPTFTFKNMFNEKSKTVAIAEAAVEVALPEMIVMDEPPKDRFYTFSDVFSEDKLQRHHVNPERPLLVLWPPPQRQKYLSGPLFEISTATNLLICVADPAIDIFPLMTWSGLLDVLEKLGFQSQAKRSVAGSKIRFSIDPFICPGFQRYELIVTAERVSITASDQTGLFYAVQTLVQMIQLQSVVKTTSNATILTLPTISIHDWADISTRGVLWTYRGNARMSTSQLRDSVELLSKLRINSIFLTIDTEDLASNVGNGIPLENAPTTKIYALDEVCKRNHIDLIPTIVVNSIKQVLPSEASKNFSHAIISLFILLDYESIHSELKGDWDSNPVITSDDVLAAGVNAVERILKETQAVGFRSVILTSCQWANDFISPSSIAAKHDLHVQEKYLNDYLPASLFLKPVVDIRQYVENVINYLADVDRGSSSSSLLPAFIDSDFLYPTLLTKFNCFIYGGLSWNRASSADILGVSLKLNSPEEATLQNEPDKPVFEVPEYFGSHIRHALKYLLFQSSKNSNALLETVTTMLLDILSGNIHNLVDSQSQPSQPLTMSAFFFSSYTPPQSSISDDGPHKYDPSKEPLYFAESKLWPIATSSAYISNIPLPSKAKTARCLRVYRRIINAAAWKPSLGLHKLNDAFDGYSNRNARLITALESLPYSIDIEEFLSVIHLFSIISKAIIFAHNVNEKATSSPRAYKSTKSDPATRLTLHSSIKQLPPGTKSDIANSLLEVTEHLSVIWKKKFDRLNSSSRHTSGCMTADSWLIDRVLREGSEPSDDQILTFTRAKFLLQTGHVVPASPIFTLLTQDLKMPKSIDDVLAHMFE